MFNEKNMEFSKKQGKEIPVWQSPKYIEARDKAIELINSGKYDLNEGDFWILMNETSTGKMGYSGLIISHNGCLKINDKLENRINPRGFTRQENGYNNSLVYTYVDDEVREEGEVSKDNCKNAYPYAMAFKRCFDRAVLKKCKLAYSGVYSDSEADEFTKQINEEIPKITTEKIKILKDTQKKYKRTDEELQEMLEKVGCKSLEELDESNWAKVGNMLGGKK